MATTLQKARDVLMKIAKGDKRVKADPAPVVYVSSLGDSAVEMMLRFWVATSDYWDVLFAFTEQAKRDFDAAGISIPFNQLDVHLDPTKAEAKPPVRAGRAKAADKTAG